MATERVVGFTCAEAPLVGILHEPRETTRIGMLVVVGGPQYRVGSHRQFVLLARHLAEHGTPVLRFDYRGIGDSGGDTHDFLSIDEDIKAALDVFCRECPGVEEIYVWGLCDAASAALLYAHTDRRIRGLVLCNPWVRTETMLARTIMRDYYTKQLFSSEFWRRLLRGRLRVGEALSSLVANVRRSLVRTGTLSSRDNAGRQTAADGGHFVDRMLAGLKSFDGRVLLILSGNDLTAAEFENLVRGDREWTDALRDKRVTWRRLPEANHTFSTRLWRDQVASWTAQWLQDDGDSR